MSIFGSILSKIFSAAESIVEPAKGEAVSNAAAPSPVAPPPSPATATEQAAAPAVTAGSPTKTVDVEAVLTKMAETHGGGGNWKTSIVDLLKLLDLDSSLDARKQLATEIGVRVGSDGTAEENVALHKVVMAKIEENGGTVPASLKG